MPGNYDPADSGLAKYFLAMLDDADRNRQYSEGIRCCIGEFIRVEKRAPTVLDVGVGTGMLSGLCILHGAKHVTGVDVNGTMTALAKEALKVADPTGKKFRVKLVQKGPSQLGDAKFDILVSEILGTLTTFGVSASTLSLTMAPLCSSSSGSSAPGISASGVMAGPP